MSLEVILYGSQIHNIVQEQGKAIAEYYKQRHTDVVNVYPVMAGCMFYAPALMQAIWNQRTGLRMRVAPSLSRISFHDVLVIDTIFDTGRTTNHIVSNLFGHELVFSYLIRKGRKPALKPVFCGPQVPEVYVYGYGLDDSKGEQRELPHIVYNTVDQV